MRGFFITHTMTHLLSTYMWETIMCTECWSIMATPPTSYTTQLHRTRLIPTNALLVGFGGIRVFPLGAVTLSVTVGNYPQQITKDVTFLVVDCSSTYNGILGRPTLNSWKAATSTYHLMIKFPMEYGIGELRGDHMAARECYIAMLEMEDHQQTMCIEE